MTERVVVLVDMDCFYVQVEEREQPHLIQKPTAVVQYNPWRGGGIIAVNYEARAFEVKRGMRGDEARKKCPDIQLIQVPVNRGKADLTKYREAGKEVIDVLVEFSDCVERASIDEAYVDLTSVVERRMEEERVSAAALPSTWVVGFSGEDQLEWDGTERETGVTRWLERRKEEEEPSLEKEEEEDSLMMYWRRKRVGTKDDRRLAIAAAHCEEMRRAILLRTKFKCSAGIAHNKMLAKLACGIHKPNQQTVLPQGEVADLWDAMPVGKVRNLGGKLGDFLKESLGCVTMGDLARVPLTTLLTHYDLKTAHWLRDLGLGIDNEPVTSRQLPKSIGCGKNFQGRETLNTVAKVRQWTRSLADELSERLTADKTSNKRTARTLTVGVRLDKDDRWYSLTRSCRLPSYDPERITRVALSLFEHRNTATTPDVWSPPIKHVSLSASKFEDIGGSGMTNIADMFKRAEKRASLTSIPSTAPNLPRKPLNDSANSLNIPEASPSTSARSDVPSTAPNGSKMALNVSKRPQNILSFFSSTPGSSDLSVTAPNVPETFPDISTSPDIFSSASNSPENSSNVPETLQNTPTIPNLSCTVSNAPKDTSNVAAESLNVPETLTNAPKNTPNIFAKSLNVPKTFPHTPTSSKIPSAASNAPKNPSSVPAKTLIVPKTPPNNPKRLNHSSTTSNDRKNLQNIIAKSREVPETWPKNRARPNIPSTSSGPKISSNAPETLGNTHTTPNLSSTASNAPKNPQNVAAESLNVPETLTNTTERSNISSPTSNGPKNSSNAPETLTNTPQRSNISFTASNATETPSDVLAESLTLPETLPNILDTLPSTSSPFLSPQTPSMSSSFRKSFFKSYLSKKTSISPPSPSSSCSSSSFSQPPSDEEEEGEEDTMENFNSQSLNDQSPAPTCHQATELTNRIAAKVREGHVSFPSQVSHEERSAEVGKGQSNSFFKNFLLNRLKNCGDGGGSGSGGDLKVVNVVKCGENEGGRDSEEEEIVVLDGEGREERERWRDRNGEDGRKVNRSERNDGEEKENMDSDGDDGEIDKNDGDSDISVTLIDVGEGNGGEKDDRSEKCGRGRRDNYETEEEFEGRETMKEGRREMNKEKEIVEIYDKEGDNIEERLNEQKREKTDKFKEIERKHDKRQSEKHAKETEEGNNEEIIIITDEEEEETEEKRRNEWIERAKKHISRTQGNNEGKTRKIGEIVKNYGKRRNINKLEEMERKHNKTRVNRHSKEAEEGENEENTGKTGGKEEENEKIDIERENSLSPELFSSWEVENTKEKMRNRTKRKKRVRFADSVTEAAGTTHSATKTTSMTESATGIMKEVHPATRGILSQNSATIQSQVKTSARAGSQVDTSSREDIQSARGDVQAHTSATSKPGTPQASHSANNTTARELQGKTKYNTTNTTQNSVTSQPGTSQASNSANNTTARELQGKTKYNTTNTTQNSATIQPGTSQASHSANNTTTRELEGKTSHNTTNTTTSAQTNPGTSNDSARDRILAQELFPDLDNVDTSLLPMLPENLRAEVEVLLAQHSGTSKRHSTLPEDEELTGMLRFVKRSPKEVPYKVKASSEGAYDHLTYSARNFEITGGELMQCEECQACFAPGDLTEHQDYHLAVRLQNDLKQSGEARAGQVPKAKSKKRGRSSAQDLAGMKSQKIDAFFRR